MFELGILLVLLIGAGLFIGLIFALLGLVFKLILLPFQIGFWLLKGVLGLGVLLVGLLVFLPVFGVALPALLLIFGWPLAIIALIIWLIQRETKPRQAA
ncbi:MAG: hypothetical protein JW819_13940 [Candidatus Krumholzibacteriota bacterium]|nr:hypothetical protein [Candidatus Krumholzibacteriota bacterium]